MKMDMTVRSWLVAMASLFLALFFWAVIPLFLIHFSHSMDTWTVNGVRYAFTAGFWAPFVLATLRRFSKPARQAAWRAVVLPAFAHAFGQIFFGMAPYYNNATMMNFGCRLSIPFTTLFGFCLLKSERALMRKPLFWVGLICSLGGFFLMFAEGFGTDGTSAIGMCILLGFAVLWGIYVVLVRRNLSAYPAYLSYGMISMLSAPLLMALLFALGDWQVLLTLAPAQWGWLFFSALIGLALSHVLFQRAIVVMGPIASEGGMLLIPFQTALLAHFWLGERLNGLQWVAGLILIAGCALLIGTRFSIRSTKDASLVQNRHLDA